MRKAGRQLRKKIAFITMAAIMLGQAGIPVSAAEFDLLEEALIESEVQDLPLP